ncbi:class I SAM-dependent methyltransferase [candidate division FCPU426 bacterium]|nr:class I SAM-dependent methyltransferase [candidate division FCPU426 bacterium]
MAEHVYPAWLGWLLVSPTRKFYMDPDRILGSYIKGGMTVLEPGCGMGFFSLPAARMAGPNGRVICIDLQPGMIAGLKKRAARAGLADRIETRVCTARSLHIEDLQGRIDFCFAIGVVHETPDGKEFFRQVAESLKPGGKLLFVEPKGPVTQENYEKAIEQAEEVGLKFRKKIVEQGGRSAIMYKK